MTKWRDLLIHCVIRMEFILGTRLWHGIEAITAKQMWSQPVGGLVWCWGKVVCR